MMGLTIVVLDRMEKAVARGTKGQKSGPPEKWAPGRTLESTTKTWLSEEDISEAAQLLAAINDKTTANLDAELQSIARRSGSSSLTPNVRLPNGIERKSVEFRSKLRNF
jgi:hypothetical protein